jgi:hypothetical protein
MPKVKAQVSLNPRIQDSDDFKGIVLLARRTALSETIPGPTPCDYPANGEEFWDSYAKRIYLLVRLKRISNCSEVRSKGSSGKGGACDGLISNQAWLFRTACL